MRFSFWSNVLTGTYPIRSPATGTSGLSQLELQAWHNRKSRHSARTVRSGVANKVFGSTKFDGKEHHVERT
jgi:hypothetical protein